MLNLRPCAVWTLQRALLAKVAICALHQGLFRLAQGLLPLTRRWATSWSRMTGSEAPYHEFRYLRMQEIKREP